MSNKLKYLNSNLAVTRRDSERAVHKEAIIENIYGKPEKFNQYISN